MAIGEDQPDNKKSKNRENKILGKSGCVILDRVRNKKFKKMYEYNTWTGT